MNTNNEIIGNNIKLVPLLVDDDETYIKELDNHLCNDGDYEISTGEYYKPGESPWFLISYVDLGFAILDKNNIMVGLVGLCPKNKYEIESKGVLSLGYYIFKDERRKGYAFESIKILLDAYFNEKLTYSPNDIKTKILKPLCVKVEVNKANEASVELIKKIGFKYEGINHYRYKIKNKRHAVLYYMTKRIYKNLV